MAIYLLTFVLCLRSCAFHKRLVFELKINCQWGLKDKHFSAARVLQCIESKQWHILFISQLIWIAVPYLLKLTGDVLSSARGCSCVCCRRWLKWSVGDASQHLFCFPHTIILVYCCSILLDYIKLLRINRIASAAVHLKLASSSWEKSAARWTVEEYFCWRLVGSHCTVSALIEPQYPPASA